MHPRRLLPLAATTLALALAACGSGGEEATAALESDAAVAAQVARERAFPGLGHDLVVMTRNLYVGADLFEPFLVSTPEEALAKAAEVFQQILASDPPGRMAAIADELALVRPDLVGVEEGYRFVVTSLDPATAGAVLLDLDFLGALEQALAERPRPLHYRRVAEEEHTVLELPLPFGDPPAPVLVRMVDRDAIYAAPDVLVRSTGGGNFENDLEVSLAGFPISQKRGWVEVEAKVHGDPFTFATTHLEVKDFGPLQSLQAGELVATLAGSDPLVLVGDFNSDPSDPPFVVTIAGTPTAFPTPYRLLTTLGGLTDVWPAVRRAPGLTCCFDADLAPPSRELVERVDLVLVRGAIRPRAAFRVGLVPQGELGDRWPSDHAGVVAVVRLREPGKGHGGPDDDCVARR
jgi:hypothetical protein